MDSVQSPTGSVLHRAHAGTGVTAPGLAARSATARSTTVPGPLPLDSGSGLVPPQQASASGAVSIAHETARSFVGASDAHAHNPFLNGIAPVYQDLADH